MWFSFGEVLNSIRQGGVRLIASRFVFELKRGSIAGRNGDDACSRGSPSPNAGWGRGSRVDDRIAVFVHISSLPSATGGISYRAW